MTRRSDWSGQDGAIPFAVVGVAGVAGVLGLAWAGQDWANALLREAGGELTVWVLRGAFWALDLVGLQASTAPVTTDWYTPVLEGPALPLYALAALVMVATLVAEVLAGIVTGNTPRIVQAVFRALVAGMLASAGGALLLAIGGALSDLGRIALESSGTTVDAPLVPLQQVLMDTAQQRDSGAELFVVFLAGLVIVFTSLAIYFTLAMRPVLLAAVIVFLPVAHALSVWTPMRRVQVRAWALAIAVLLADAAILSMFAITNTVAAQPEGIDRLIFGTFGLLLAALAPAALARIIGVPELQTAVQAMSTGSKMLAIGAGVGALKGGLLASRLGSRSGGPSGPVGGAGVLDAPGPGAGGSGGGPGPMSVGPSAGPGAGAGPASAASAGLVSSSAGGDSATGPATGSNGGTAASTTVSGPSSHASTPVATAGRQQPADRWRSALTRPHAGAAHG